MPTEIENLNSITDADLRKQAKYDHIVAVMNGEGGNFQAGIYSTLLSQFALALVSQGYDPISVATNISKETRDLIRAGLADQGMIRRKPLDG